MKQRLEELAEHIAMMRVPNIAWDYAKLLEEIGTGKEFSPSVIILDGDLRNNLRELEHVGLVERDRPEISNYMIELETTPTMSGEMGNPYRLDERGPIKYTLTPEGTEALRSYEGTNQGEQRDLIGSIKNAVPNFQGHFNLPSLTYLREFIRLNR